MKHFILALFAMLVSVSVSAQDIYVKTTQGKAYYRIKYETGKEMYAMLNAQERPTLQKLEDFEARISEKKYIEINAEEIKTMGISSYDARGIINDERTIKVEPLSRIRITTSSPLQQGENYKLFRVVSAKDPELVGQSVVCQILERRKSNISGSEGRLSLLPLYINTPKGGVPLMPTPIHRRGLNRTNVKAGTFFLIIPIFIPGTRAEISEEEVLTLRLE